MAIEATNAWSVTNVTMEMTKAKNDDKSKESEEGNEGR